MGKCLQIGVQIDSTIDLWYTCMFTSSFASPFFQMNETFQQPGRWHDVILTPTPRASTEPLTHYMFYTLKGLTPSSVYEAIVQAKNRYGWNEVSFCQKLFCVCVFSLFDVTTFSYFIHSFITKFLILSLLRIQVSDIFQFYTQRNMNDPRVEDMELVASSTSRNSSSNVRLQPVIIVLAVVLTTSLHFLFKLHHPTT